MDPVGFLYLAVAVPYSLFVVLYLIRSPWWQTALGRSLLLSKMVIAALAINATLALWLGDYPGRDAVRGFIVGGALVAGWWQLTLLIRAQRAARRCRDHEEIK